MTNFQTSIVPRLPKTKPAPKSEDPNTATANMRRRINSLKREREAREIAHADELAKVCGELTEAFKTILTAYASSCQEIMTKADAQTEQAIEDAQKFAADLATLLGRPPVDWESPETYIMDWAKRRIEQEDQREKHLRPIGASIDALEQMSRQSPPEDDQHG